ncbi:NAD(P)/FAD-dependent oxidoreductase [Photobacterium sp. DNB23_23_1]|uniref:FAD-dependent oxidoreductase n=1 Tax=Photobacterium pectinilyticum TaxID=2906793 RepID=A0ABT1N673_9GAMM|nr:FAD-dependent oxidoreductase [Photobacterium sp. ZSDE20]MCQ1060235.1 FAD-dependent oxidoreductase [Photobacterium sp. ZSDE20]MDD1827536.1 FAD-dependent oxidoreductase [Photobacterium sp. ZSDE20]
MKIAIVGSGISGLTCAHYLDKQHNITVFEANDYIGGHTATVDVDVASGQYAIDTGFIVFNDRTYPNFERLLAEIGVCGKPTEMSFSVHNALNGLEYNGNHLMSMFAQKRNTLNPIFYRFIFDILRFNKLAKNVDLATEMSQTLGDFLKANKFNRYFCENYILPMGAAIWSSTLSDMRQFPFTFFVRFFRNHGLLEVSNRPQWYVIPGGSREYVKHLIAPFEDKIRLACPVTSIKRAHGKVAVTANGISEIFDHVIFACHSDQALNMLADSTEAESQILGALKYQKNDVVLHTDESLLPKRKAAWASWNYHLGHNENGQWEDKQTTLTYNMNILQGIEAPETFCVTLNQTDQIAPEKILRKFVYSHPVFSTDSIQAQQCRDQINGVDNTWYCGAYWYNGFHEDGVRSALDVVESIAKQTFGQNSRLTGHASDANRKSEPAARIGG